MTKKVAVSAILRTAEQIAAIAGISREEAVEALKKAHEHLGYELDLGASTGNGAVLDFTRKADPTKTQRLLH